MTRACTEEVFNQHKLYRLDEVGGFADDKLAEDCVEYGRGLAAVPQVAYRSSPPSHALPDLSVPTPTPAN
jgi:hypothetical protein